MTIFNELGERYSQYQAAEQEYLEELANAAKSVALTFPVYLGLEDTLWVDSRTGYQKPYVQLGEGDQDSFVSRSWRELYFVNKIMSFSIALTIHTPDKPDDRVTFVTQLTVGKKSNTFLFRVEKGKGIIEVHALDQSPRRFDELHAEIVKVIRASFDPATYTS